MAPALPKKDFFELPEGIDLAAVHKASIELSELFLAEVEARCPELTLASPRDPAGIVFYPRYFDWPEAVRKKIGKMTEGAA